MTEANLDFLTIGNDLNEMAVDAGGFRRLQHFNENASYHRGTLVERGGYGIRNDSGDAPALKGGKTQTIKHRGGNSSVMMVAQSVDVALIGWTSRYYVAEYDDPAQPGKRVVNFIPFYMPPDELPGANGKCRQGVTLFVVLKDDPARELWAIDFRGFITPDAERLIFAAKALAGGLSDKLPKVEGKKVTVHPFAHWLTLSVAAESKMVGKVEQSPVTPPEFAKNDAGEIARQIVSKDDYAKFIDLRRELDNYLPQSRYALKGIQQPALAASQSRPALNAPVGNGDVNI